MYDLRKTSIFSLVVATITLALNLGACGRTPQPNDIGPISEAALIAATATLDVPAQADVLPPQPQIEPQAEVGDQAVVMLNISGGEVGYCDTLIVDVAGRYTVQSCRYENLTGQLTPADLASLHTWYENLAPFNLSFKDNPEDPASVVSDVVFTGQGGSEAGQAQQLVILEWANNLFGRVQPRPTVPEN